jgi:hypothetical protein
LSPPLPVKVRSTAVTPTLARMSNYQQRCPIELAALTWRVGFRRIEVGDLDFYQGDSPHKFRSTMSLS